jgi:hypothetical protein
MQFSPVGLGPLGRPRHRWMNNIKMDLRWDEVVWTGLVWFRIGTSGGLLGICGFHKMLGNFLVATQLAASQEGLVSVDLLRLPCYFISRRLRYLP